MTTPPEQSESPAAVAGIVSATVELFIKKDKKRRVCRGDLAFTDAAMYFICSEDLNVWKANAGGHGTGLIGVAVGTAIGAAIAKGEGTDGEQKPPSPDASLDANLANNEYSFKTEPAGIDCFGSSMFSGRFMRVGKDRYIFRKIAKEDVEKIKAWCTQHNVSTRGF
jgi:hypothetical protein